MTWMLLLAPLALGAVVLPCLFLPVALVVWLVRTTYTRFVTRPAPTHRCSVPTRSVSSPDVEEVSR